MQRHPDTLQRGFGCVFLTQAALGTRSSQPLQGAGSKLWAQCMCRTLIRGELEGPFQARMEPFHGSVLTGEEPVGFPSLEHWCVPL